MSYRAVARAFLILVAVLNWPFRKRKNKRQAVPHTENAQGQQPPKEPPGGRYRYYKHPTEEEHRTLSTHQLLEHPKVVGWAEEFGGRLAMRRRTAREPRRHAAQDVFRSLFWAPALGGRGVMGGVPLSPVDTAKQSASAKTRMSLANRSG